MGKTGIIALVDDDPDDLELLTEAFLNRNKELEIRTYTSGKQLFEAVNNLNGAAYPHLFIIDYNMPEQSGAELIEMLCQYEPLKAVPKVILSTSDSQVYQRICKEKGADHYFKKPNSFDQWLHIATMMLRLIDRM